MYLLEHFPYFIILKYVFHQGFEPFGAPVVSKQVTVSVIDKTQIKIV